MSGFFIEKREDCLVLKTNEGLNTAHCNDSIEQPAFFRLSDVNHELQIEKIEHQALFSPDYQFDGILGLYSLSNGLVSIDILTYSTLSGDHCEECCDWERSI